MIDDLLTGNADFVSTEFAPNETYYHAIATRQRPKVLWIGCSDSRVSEHQMTGSKPGTMFVHRNVANIVAFNDVNISAILEYGVVHLKIEDIIVCGHTRCGGIAAIEDGVHENYIGTTSPTGCASPREPRRPPTGSRRSGTSTAKRNSRCSPRRTSSSRSSTSTIWP